MTNKQQTVTDILDELERELEQLERIRERVITITIPTDCGELHQEVNHDTIGN